LHRCSGSSRGKIHGEIITPDEIYIGYNSTDYNDELAVIGAVCKAIYRDKIA
jgi:exonuclease I